MRFRRAAAPKPRLLAEPALLNVLTAESGFPPTTQLAETGALVQRVPLSRIATECRSQEFDTHCCAAAEEEDTVRRHRCTAAAGG